MNNDIVALVKTVLDEQKDRAISELKKSINTLLNLYGNCYDKYPSYIYIQFIRSSIYAGLPLFRLTLYGKEGMLDLDSIGEYCDIINTSLLQNKPEYLALNDTYSTLKDKLPFYWLLRNIGEEIYSQLLAVIADLAYDAFYEFDKNGIFSEIYYGEYLGFSKYLFTLGG